jgi:flagellar motility protein MotE (MotC chaperone)
MRAARPLLLLSVVLAGLLGLKGLSLVDGALTWLGEASAYAVEDPAPAERERAPAAESDAPPPPPLPEDNAPVALPSQAELDLQSRVAQRMRALDRRAAELDTREQLITVAERRLDEREQRLIALRDDIQVLVDALNTARDNQLDAIVQVYATMEPEAAAPVLETLMVTDRDTLIQIAASLQERNPRRYSQIMEAANARFVAELTTLLAARAQPPLTRAEMEARRVAAVD